MVGMSARPLLWIACLGLGCGKDPPPSTPPTAATTPAPTGDKELRPGEVDNTYVGHGEDEDAATGDETAADDADAEQDATPAGLTAAGAHTLAESALDEVLDPYAPRVVTPLLPTEWPPTSGQVQVLAYPLDPLETGVTRYTLSRATHRVLITVTDQSVTTEEIAGKKKIGTHEQVHEHGEPEVRKGEQALIDIVGGEAKAEKLQYQIALYTKWIDGHGKVGQDVAKRHKAFIEFARDWGH